jgi:hypothetical protein
MKIHAVIPTLLLAMLAHSEEAAPPLPSGSALPRAPMSPPGIARAPDCWLGLDLAKPDQSLASHLPALPAGVGFIVKTVHQNGPAAAAGLEDDDLVWKFNDQLLINEAQLSTLLRMHKPGDAITLTVFRGGGAIEIPLTLERNPGQPIGLAEGAIEEALLFNEPGPMRVVNMANREAYIADSQGRAVVRKVDDGYWLTIQNAAGEVIHDAAFNRSAGKCEADNSIPADWTRRAYALRRGLEHALNGGIAQQRQPRPRVVPPPPAKNP